MNREGSAKVLAFLLIQRIGFIRVVIFQDVYSIIVSIIVLICVTVRVWTIKVFYDL